MLFVSFSAFKNQLSYASKSFTRAALVAFYINRFACIYEADVLPRTG